MKRDPHRVPVAGPAARTRRGLGDLHPRPAARRRGRGLRLDKAWRSYIIVADVWKGQLERDGAIPKILWTGDHSGPSARADPRRPRGLGRGSSSAGSSALATEARARRGVSTTPSIVERWSKPAVVVVTEEFVTHRPPHGRAPQRPADLRLLVLPVPARRPARRGSAPDCCRRVPPSSRRPRRPLTRYQTERRTSTTTRSRSTSCSLEQGWGDGLPLLPPTEERVRSLIAATPYHPDDVVGEDAAARTATATVELVAINAAMAGVRARRVPATCSPPLEAMQRAEVQPRSGSPRPRRACPCAIIVQRPVARRARHRLTGRLHGRRRRARLDAPIGRAVAAVPAQHRRPACGRDVARASSASRPRFGLCFGEWEERSPWPSLAEQRGFAADQDVVTVHGGKGTLPARRHQQRRPDATCST